MHSNSLVTLYDTLADADPVELLCACASVDGQVENETTGLFITLVGNGCCVAPPHPAAGKGFTRTSVHSVHSKQYNSGHSGGVCVFMAT